mmetsp:Transcript_24138/g.21111  ORF Transcript_24138/g.21111 Transcript_24138/m.21111 type:complete len:154 (-) Transcript_24138:173-634(-)|eukprot:CAMPEP_0201565970 /NCGR_PEP_ID=MMETSP0190_2-20130828/5451_1 /ASSEMBLY_ACC=CAM_ASM_000263 /TAXON_ID=37353 /ORGANISM="Rosalina sp." /LENGTH=153 /DNA_ID=CAMNT_0047984093 /DNA_START=39 /DNA_END=500 /DNA_ORIENTATION=+
MIGTWTLLFAIISFVSYGIRMDQTNEQAPLNGLAIYEHNYIHPSNLERISNNNPLHKTGTRIANELNKFTSNAPNYNPIIERLNQLTGVRYDTDIDIQNEQGNTNDGPKIDNKQTNDGTNSISMPKKRYKTRRAHAKAQGKNVDPGEIRSIFY